MKVPMTKKELMELTGLSLSTINRCIRNLDQLDEGKEPLYSEFIKKRGRKAADKSERYGKLRQIVGSDNSLTLSGVNNQLRENISISQISGDLKAARLSQKQLKKRPSILLTRQSFEARIEFCSHFLGE